MNIVDTGFWLALANKQDAVHIAAKKRFQDLANQQFITTWGYRDWETMIKFLKIGRAHV